MNSTKPKASLLNSVHVKTFAVLSYFILLLLIGVSVYIVVQALSLARTGAAIPFDITSLLTAWAVIVTADITECGAVTGLYIWKAKNEQRHQDLQRIFKDIPKEYISDTKADITSVTTTFLSN